MQLVEEAVEGCWIGFRARPHIMSGSEIGSVYAPPSQASSSLAFTRSAVETVIDVDLRSKVCSLAGFRYILLTRNCRAGNSSVRRAV